MLYICKRKHIKDDKNDIFDLCLVLNCFFMYLDSHRITSWGIYLFNQTPVVCVKPENRIDTLFPCILILSESSDNKYNIFDIT